MKKERLLDVLGKVDAELIAEAAPEDLKEELLMKSEREQGNKSLVEEMVLEKSDDELIIKTENRARKKIRKEGRFRWGRKLVTAACMMLVVWGIWDTLERLDYTWKAGCGAYPGKIVDGIYYYYVPHEGVMQYTPKENSKRLLHTYWLEEWDVNDYGIYYWQDMSVYVCDHKTGTRTKLYTANHADYTHIRFQLMEDDNLIVTHYNKNTEMVYELLLDGVSGKSLGTVMKPTSYDATENVYYSDMNYSIGDRKIVLQPLDLNCEKFVILENGQNLLPNGWYTSNYTATYFEDVLCFCLQMELSAKNSLADFAKVDLDMWENITVSNDMEIWLMIYQDGTNQLITIPNERYEGGTAEFFFYPAVEDNAVGCVDTSTGETWLLEADSECDIHDLEADGEYIYTCAPWAEETACWKLVYDADGKPVGMSIVEGDIRSNR